MDPERPTCAGAPWRWRTDDEMWECCRRGWGVWRGLHTPDVNFHKDSLICALWPPLVQRGSGIPDNGAVNTSMCSEGASEVRWHIWLPCCCVINSNPCIPFMFNRAGSFDGEHMLIAVSGALQQHRNVKQLEWRYIFFFFFFFLHSNQRISHMTCCDVFIWCFPACLSFTGRQMQQCGGDRPHWLWLHSQIPHISHRLTSSGGGCNLKTKPILCVPCQGWEMSADSSTKDLPFLFTRKEKFSFH